MEDRKEDRKEEGVVQRQIETFSFKAEKEKRRRARLFPFPPYFRSLSGSDSAKC